MTITLITGANKGLGFETATQLTALGHTVYIGARNPELGREAAARIGARSVRLDVTDQASVDAAAAAVLEAEGTLDVLINNAGISDGLPPVTEVTADGFARLLETNVVGVVRVTKAFLPLLETSAHPVIVNVGSSIGSKGIVTDPERMQSRLPALTYGTSKAAVVMLTIQYAKGLPRFKVNVVEPGFTATDLNNNSGHQTVAEGASVIVRMATIGADGPTGTFVDAKGPLPW